MSVTEADKGTHESECLSNGEDGVGAEPVTTASACNSFCGFTGREAGAGGLEGVFGFAQQVGQ